MARNLRLRAGVLLASSFALGILVMGAQPAAAATLVVDDDNFQCPAAPYTKIQDAVDDAGPGDTIMVCAGTYPEPDPGPLTINKSLTLEGAQVGVDARGRVALESIVTDPQGTSVSASDVVLDGFTFADSSLSAFTGFGIFLNPGVSSTEIVNNIIRNNIVGIGLANNGAQAVIQHNWIRDNTRPGGASGSGIYTDQFVGGPTVRNVLIDENWFTGHAGFGGAINISNTDFTNGVFDLTVTSNRFDMNSRAFIMFNTHDSLFDDNDVGGSTFVGSADVRLFDNNRGLLFTNNDFHDGAGMHAIRFSFFLGAMSADVDFHQNNIERYGLTGLTVDAGSHTGTVDAECNWWNSPSGPFNVPDNPTGTGEEVVGDADFTPWLVARAPGGRCIGGVPSTPGKVTGGGQVEGDPLFSPLGELISLPALIPNLTGGGSQSSFGFVAKCCPESGNLQYQDHGANVRIKALTVDRLVISSPGTSCPATPGSKHAELSGRANVTGPTGTTNEEDYFVEVDDCGEPGTNDSFGIETDSYSHPPSTLVGGNIQIHKP